MGSVPDVWRIGPVLGRSDFMDHHISIYESGRDPTELGLRLQQQLGEATDVRLEVKHYRAVETAVLIAIVGALGTGFGALVTGLLKVAAEKSAKKVVLCGRSGRRVEVPADCPPDKISGYVEEARNLDVERIEL
jgi:hypothetical protein